MTLYHACNYLATHHRVTAVIVIALSWAASVYGGTAI